MSQLWAMCYFYGPFKVLNDWKKYFVCKVIKIYMKLKFLCPSVKLYWSHNYTHLVLMASCFGAISVLLSYTVAIAMTWHPKPSIFTLCP